MFETIRKPIRKELTCESIKLSNIKITVKNIYNFHINS